MPAWTVEMLGDGDKEILAHAVKVAARGHWICSVTLEADGKGRDITSVADYALGNYTYNPSLLRDEVTLTLWDDRGGDDGRGGPWIHENGQTDVQTVAVEDISELKIY